MSVDTIARWVSTIVNPTIPVIISHQNAPVPDGDYITVAFVSDAGGCYPIVDVEPTGAGDLALFTADNDNDLAVDVSVFSADGHGILNDIRNRASLPPYVGRPIMSDCGTIRGPAFFNDSGFSNRYTCEFMFRDGHVTQDLDPRIQTITIAGYIDGLPITIGALLGQPIAPPESDPVCLVMRNGDLVLGSDGSVFVAG